MVMNAKLYLPEEYEGQCGEYRDQDGGGPDHVAEERRHFNLILFRDRFDHEVRRIADIRVGSHEYGTAGNRHQNDTGRPGEA